MYGKQQGTLHLQWPSSVYSPLRKLGDLCMDQEPRNRPTAEQVGRRLSEGTNLLLVDMNLISAVPF
jgi:hypothetical protein